MRHNHSGRQKPYEKLGTAMTEWREFHGPNAGWVAELYERYRRDPAAVDEATRNVFERWTPPDGTALAADGLRADEVEHIMGAVNLAQAVREYGHLAAQLDPLGAPPPGDPTLHPAFHGVDGADLRCLPASLIGGPCAVEAENAWEAIQNLRRVYTSHIGYDYDHIRIPAERDWLREAAESERFRPPHDSIHGRALLERLTRVEVFEHFLHRIFPGKTRFSIEGLDMLVPMLDEIVSGSASGEICTVLVGMAHRGRLNVLAHVLDKPYAQILAEFKDPARGHKFAIRDDLGWTGDVKYHKGGYRPLREASATELLITMPPNPSHLEHINPVLLGMARAADTGVQEPGEPEFFERAALPVLIHGDTAFPGEGVVAETLNLSRLPGYYVGGTVHVIANNQLGYTTDPGEGRSTLYASDLAKGFKVPVVHVNADDPVACIEAARLAFAYRARFHKDFVIDLIGYRRYGHNEGDEPRFTQPVMYERVEDHPRVREQWAEELVRRGELEPDAADNLVRARMEELQSVLESLDPEADLAAQPPEVPPPGAARKVKTAVPADRLRELNSALLHLPEGFNVNPKLERAMERRRKALSDADASSVDWATAEDLALGSILADGIAARVTGEDVERGTFSQRHAVFHDVQTGETYTPLQHIPQAEAAFEIHNSPLTENATVGFELGYNVMAPGRLVIWEAQYGDFINVAQPMIDEFLVSGRAKWGLTPSLVLLLPHGYEGQGPDHSSGRLERFLQMAAETNVRIANPTTAGQYFHLLRRQAMLLESDPLPLVVMTPKSLLRHPRSASSLRDLSEGRWQAVVDDSRARDNPDAPDAVGRLILCSGKVYVDLVTSDHRDETHDIAIARVEQLYPFPADEIEAVLERYPQLGDVVWVQEEPENMGAWDFVRPRLRTLIGDRCPLRYVGRPRSSSPAEGSASWHAVNQATLVKQAFHVESDVVGDEQVVLRQL